MGAVYNFENIDTQYGVINVSLSLRNNGSGTVAVSDKYFTEIEKTGERDFFGGFLQAEDLSLKVEYDKDNLFGATIFQELEQDNGFIGVSVTNSASKVLFLGSIKKESIQETVFYATNDALDGSYSSYSFIALNYFELLKSITKQELVDALIASPAVFPYQSAYQTLASVISPASNKANIYRFYTIKDLMRCAFSLIEPMLSSISVDVLEYDFGGDLLFASYGSKEIYDNAASEIGGVVDARNASLTSSATYYGMPLLEVGLLVCDDTPSNNLVGLFIDGGSFNTAYDIVVSILNDLGLVLKSIFSTTGQVYVTVVKRDDGDTITLNNVLGYSRQNFGKTYQDSIKVSNNTSGNDYEKDLKKYPIAPFSTSILNVANYDDPTTHSNAAKNLCVMRSFTSSAGVWYCAIAVRDICRGENYITNSTFASNITGWTGSAGTWSHSTAVDSPNGSSGVMKATGATTLTVETEIASGGQVYNPTQYALFFSLRVSSISASPTITVSFLDADLNVIDSGSINLVGFSSFIFGRWGKFSVKSSSRVTEPISAVVNDIDKKYKYVRISIVDSGVFDYYLDDIYLYRYGSTVEQHLGLYSEEIFANNKISTITVNLDGIDDTINLGDNFNVQGKTYYIKKIMNDYVQNETEIEAINYQ